MMVLLFPGTCQGKTQEVHRDDECINNADICPENIIFVEDTSVLIDYDLARKKGHGYPFGYQLMDGLQSQCIMKIKHDRISLGKIIAHFFPDETEIVTLKVPLHVIKGKLVKKNLAPCRLKETI